MDEETGFLREQRERKDEVEIGEVKLDGGSQAEVRR